MASKRSRSLSSELPGRTRIGIYNAWFDCTNVKAIKGLKFGALNAIHYVAPGTSAGAGSVCPWMARCFKPCLASSGKGLARNVLESRRQKSILLMRDPVAYCDIHLKAALGGGKVKTSLVDVAHRMGLKPVLRLNGTSDVMYEKYGLLHELAPRIRLMDYTKSFDRVLDWLEGPLVGDGTGSRRGAVGSFSGIRNYHLTMSLGGVLDRDERVAGSTYRDILDRGGTVAAVWATKELCDRAIREGVDSFLISGQDGNVTKSISLGRRFRVVDGNETSGDLRFLDPQGVIVGLYMRHGTLRLDKGQERFAFHNPSMVTRSRHAAVVLPLPMGSIRQEGRVISIDA